QHGRVTGVGGAEIRQQRRWLGRLGDVVAPGVRPVVRACAGPRSSCARISTDPRREPTRCISVRSEPSASTRSLSPARYAKTSHWARGPCGARETVRGAGADAVSVAVKGVLL